MGFDAQKAALPEAAGTCTLNPKSMRTRDAQADVNSAAAVAVAAVSPLYIQHLSSQWTEATFEPTQTPQTAAAAATAEGFTFELEVEAPGGQRQQR